MDKEAFIARHVAVCSKQNRRRPNGRPMGGAKRRHAKALWQKCLDNKINPAWVTYGKDLRELIKLEVSL